MNLLASGLPQVNPSSTVEKQPIKLLTEISPVSGGAESVLESDFKEELEKKTAEQIENGSSLSPIAAHIVDQVGGKVTSVSSPLDSAQKVEKSTEVHENSQKKIELEKNSPEISPQESRFEKSAVMASALQSVGQTSTNISLGNPGKKSGNSTDETVKSIPVKPTENLQRASSYGKNSVVAADYMDVGLDPNPESLVVSDRTDPLVSNFGGKDQGSILALGPVPENLNKKGLGAEVISVQTFSHPRGVDPSQSALPNQRALPKKALDTEQFLNTRAALDSKYTAIPLVGEATERLAQDSKPKISKKDEDSLDTRPGSSVHLDPGLVSTSVGSKNNSGAPIQGNIVRNQDFRPVLNPETIQNLTQSLVGLKNQSTGGEIKIRLRPDHLGEIQLLIKNTGSTIDLQVKTSSSEAKAIFEDSVHQLKEQLNKQNIQLSKVDFSGLIPQESGSSLGITTSNSVSSTQGVPDSAQKPQDPGLSNNLDQSGAQQRQGFGQGDSSSRQDRWVREDRLDTSGVRSPDLGRLAMSPSMAQRSSARSTGSGRIDVVVE